MRMLLRSPRTQCERRLAQIVESGDPGPRARRRSNWLPAQFADELWRGDAEDRSWKRHRDHQWRVRRVSSAVAEDLLAIPVEGSCGNVFADLGLQDPEALKRWSARAIEALRARRAGARNA